MPEDSPLAKALKRARSEAESAKAAKAGAPENAEAPQEADAATAQASLKQEKAEHGGGA